MSNVVSIVTFLPLVGALILSLIPGGNAKAIKWAAVA